MCARTCTRVKREGARVRALIGERVGKVGRNARESGGGGEEGGVNECRKASRSGEEDGGGVSEEESPNRKDGLVLRKGECEGKRVGRSLEKSPGIGFETGKSAKNGDFGVKKMGWGGGEKMGFTADFAML